MYRLIFWSIYFCSAYCSNVINVGIIFDKDQAHDDPNWDVITQNINPELKFTVPEIKNDLPSDGFEATNMLCNMVQEENSIAALFGPKDVWMSATLETVCSHLNLPYILINWRPRIFEAQDVTFNLYPEASILAQAYGTIVKSLDWDTFVVLYEDDEGLVRLQDVLKLQEHKDDVFKNTLMVNKLDPSGDSRYILKKIRNTPISRIVLDCATDKIIDILQQAKEVKLLTDFTTSLFLTSLDAHTLDFSPVGTKSNLTTVRLFNPQEDNFQKQIFKYYPESDPSQITVEHALMHDAMILLAQSLNVMNSKQENEEISYDPIYCNSTEKYEDRYGLVEAIHETELINGLTGTFKLKDGIRDSFILEVMEVDKLDRPIGIWNSENPKSIYLTRNATEREAEIQNRLQNHKFIVTSRIGPPYLFVNPDPEASGNGRYYGYSIDLIAEIAKILNITFEFQITQDNLPANLVKDLKERRADLAICDFTITPERREAIDFSMPFMTLGIGILHKKAEEVEEANMYGFLGPLSSKVWFYIGALYLFMSFLLVFIARMSAEDWENPHPCDQNPSELENIWDLKNCCWLTLGSITTQGCDILPKGSCTRLATASWWFFSLIITSSYTANLAAFLTMSRKDDSIDSVEELATQSKVKYGCQEGGSTATFFEKSNNSLYQRMWNNMAMDKSVFESSNAKGVERILSTKNALYAFFMESTGIEYELERKCDLRRIGNLLDSKSYGIGMPMNADYRHSINSAVLKLQETGKLIELKEKWWKKQREGEPCPSEVEENTDALALENVGGVFVVLGVCLGLAFIIAILEFLWNVYNVSVEEHLSYFEAFKVELKFACNIFITKKRVKPLLSESSSSKSEEDSKTNAGILTGAASFLNINTSIIHKMGNGNVDTKSVHSKKSNSNRTTS
ncbi:glutamate receptor ionotropic, kainate 2-like [Sitophilus oryzae]|uniref:Glutamate receptor ionotropic, kainate 2-like n=1 Tax=Sitophilus oryzae TaxID=7048 RepID=A0A6J2X5K8_SITOR|nr:glutamate receptor ionotropic, kainate 2-like [Sitophilus oryzae]